MRRGRWNGMRPRTAWRRRSGAMLISSRPPQHGDLWYVDFGAPGRSGGPVGHEQGLVRPAVVLTHDRWNRRPPGTYVVIPLTKRLRGSPWHVPVIPPDGNL